MNCPALTIGITTFNRKPVLEAMARSLARVDRLDHAHVWVLDDASQQFDADFLRRLFPQAEVLRADRNSGGADQAMHRLFERFVAHGSGHLLNLDADLLVSRDLVDQCLRIIASAGADPQRCLYSVFNTPSHPATGTEGSFVLKASVGAAGTLWEHGLLAEVVRNVPVSSRFDWDWSAYLARRGIPIRVTRDSHVQHIGATGQNTPGAAEMDHGEAFNGYEGHNLASFLDHTRAGLLHAIANERSERARLQERLERQAEAIRQLSQVLQTQGGLLQQLIEEVCSTQSR